MPEYLAPGVYVEEVSFRSKSIEGVSTSTIGFVGPTRYGPADGEPELLTSFGEFERLYGGIDSLEFQDQSDNVTVNYMAHAVRAAFDNGAARIYVARAFTPADNSDFSGHATLATGSPVGFGIRARFPGAAGDMRIIFFSVLTGNLLAGTPGSQVVRTVREHDVVFIHNRGAGAIAGFYDVAGAGAGMTFTPPGGPNISLNQLIPNQHSVHLFTVNVRVRKPGQFENEETWEGLSLHPRNRNALQALFTQNPTSRSRALYIPFAFESAITSGAQLAEALLTDAVRDAIELSVVSDNELAAMGSPPGSVERPRPTDLETVFTLSGGNDGNLPSVEAYRGREAARDPGGAFIEASGLRAFESLEDISIVAAPGYSFRYHDGTINNNEARWLGIAQAMIIHCEQRMRYRICLLDTPPNCTLGEVRAHRGQLDSTHAGFYYPWVRILDPLDRDNKREILLPPSGFIAGICARTDILHGVFKAPANEVVLGARSFEMLLNKAQQDVLNPEGINCFRFFEGRGYRVWGARTISSDPEWKYLSVRRYFAYLEHSLDRGTQWAVFENNNEALWANIRSAIEDFLLNEWRNGALLGEKPDQAFFVRCDRSTMTQNDLDNGRLIVLVGVAVVKPAEFVIIRIGQMIANQTS